MPGYINKARHKYQHPMPKRPVNAPAKFKHIQYGAKVQIADVDTSPQLAKDRIRHIQDVVGTLLYYYRAVNPTLLATLIQIASCQSTATEEVATMIKKLLDYVATHSNARIRYVASDMIINLHFDVSYISEPKAKSRAGCHFWIGNKGNKDFNK